MSLVAMFQYQDLLSTILTIVVQLSDLNQEKSSQIQPSAKHHTHSTTITEQTIIIMT